MLVAVGGADGRRFLAPAILSWNSLSDIEVDDIRRHAEAMAHVIVEMYLENCAAQE